jgi:hypothetical protein
MTHLRSVFRLRNCVTLVRPNNQQPATSNQLRGLGEFALALVFVTACTSTSREPAAPTPRGAAVSTTRVGPAQEPMPAAIEPDQAAEESDLIDVEPQGDAGFVHGNRFGEHVCGSTRPQLCDATPSPVCARLKSEVTTENPTGARMATYVNGCLACADPSVVDYVIGRCKLH